jgi:hypothetical protein
VIWHFNDFLLLVNRSLLNKASFLDLPVNINPNHKQLARIVGYQSYYLHLRDPPEMYHGATNSQ